MQIFNSAYVSNHNYWVEANRVRELTINPDSSVLTNQQILEKFLVMAKDLGREWVIRYRNKKELLDIIVSVRNGTYGSD
jgi:hypothetical protein